MKKGELLKQKTFLKKEQKAPEMAFFFKKNLDKKTKKCKNITNGKKRWRKPKKGSV